MKYLEITKEQDIRIKILSIPFQTKHVKTLIYRKSKKNQKNLTNAFFCCIFADGKTVVFRSF